MSFFAIIFVAMASDINHLPVCYASGGLFGSFCVRVYSNQSKQLPKLVT